MKLCIVSDGAVRLKEAGAYGSRETFPLYVNALSKYFSKIFCVLPVYRQRSEEVSFLWRPAHNVAVVEAYPVSGVAEYYRYLPLVLAKNLPAISRCVRECDGVLLRMHGMNNYLSFMFARRYKKGIASYVTGDQKTIVREGSKYKGVKKILARGMAGVHEFMDSWIIKHANINFFLGSCLATTHGQRLGDCGRNHFSFTSLVASEDIVEGQEPELSKEKVKLLYVGRLSGEKGLPYLIEALAKLVGREIKVELDIVGEDNGAGEKDRLQRLVERLRVGSCVRFHGHVPYGDELDGAFLKSDIFVLPSVSEGVPKVLLEAMAKGLPIIATDVGGVRDIIKGLENGLLVSSKSSDAIAQAVTMLLEDRELSRRLVSNGYGFVREHTAERQAQTLADIIRTNLDNAPGPLRGIAGG